MTADTRDLIVQLCTRAAMILEDIAPLALAFMSVPDEELEASLRNLSDQLECARRLIEAAKALSVQHALRRP